jgi:glutaredoxin 3
MAQIRMYCTRSCPYCQRAERLLKKRGVKQIEKIDLGGDRKRWQAMEHETGRNTVPQIYIGNLHVGGFDELAELDRNGKLKTLLGQ